MDKLLLRQLRREKLSADTPPTDPAAWRRFLERVERAYARFGQDRYLFERAVEASADAIYITDRDGVIEYVNPAFTRITGWTSAGALGARPDILADGTTPEQVYDDLWNSITRGRVWSGRLKNRRRGTTGDEGLYWAQTTIAPLPGNNGDMSGFVAVQRDVTAEVAQEDRSRRATRMAVLRARIAEILHGHGNLHARLGEAVAALADAQALRLNGDALIVARGADDAPEIWLDVGRPRDPTRLLAILEQADPQPAYLPDAGHILLPILQAGSVIGGAWLGVAGPPQLEQVQIDLLTLVRDMIGVGIAEEHARVEVERAAAAALDAVEAKSRFLANMSHEIRTPMNGVVGMLEMLSQTELDREQQRFVETAVGSAESLLTVINDILDFSKIEAGKLDLEHIPFDIRPLAEDITTLLAPRAAERSFELACYVAPDIDTRVIGDPTRLRQVLNNLVGNAVKFTEHGEVLLRISADETAEHAAEAINTLRFEIIDTGIGMTEEALRRLFSPFEQADGSTTRRFGGTGLGLAIVKQLVELMGGRISAESTPGEGSTFRFTIPFERQPAAAQDPARADLAGLRVLAVDDNATNLTILGHYLRSWGVEAGTAADGFEALARLREAEDAGKPYDIAVLDMQMPQIDGLALARLIKSEPSIAGTRLIMISSIGQTDVEVRAAGIQYALSKPIRQSHLHDSLQELAAGRERLPQQDAGPQPAADDAPGLEGHVLLAEDNPVNQRVALSMLKRLGLTADVAADGLQAVEMACARDYRLILMDCQMPTLDGFEATAELRRREAEQPADHATEHRIVIALTANAMAGDREHCIAAGMDDYLAKPIKTAQLRACLTRWLAGQRAEPHAPRTAAMPGPLPAPAPSLPAADAGPGGGAPPEQLSVDPDAMENLKDLLADGYGRFLQLYEQKTRELTNRLHEGLAQHDIGTIEAAAHALKGSAGNIGAGELQTLAQAIEHKAKAGDLNGMELLLELAGRAQRQVLDDVARISAGESPAGRDVE